MGPSVGYSFRFTVDQNVVASVMLGTFAAFGLGLVALGALWSAGVWSNGLTRGGRDAWRRELVAWGVVGPSEVEGPLPALVGRCWQRITGRALAGGGGGILVGVAVVARLAQVGSGSPAGILAMAGLPADALIELGFVLGLGGGFLLGMRAARRVSRGVAYAELRPRRPAEYCALALGCAPFAAAGAGALVSLVARGALGPSLVLEFCGDRFVWPAWWVLGGLPALALMMALLGAWLVARIAALPRLLMLPDPERARAADDLLRAVAIGQIVGMTLLAEAALLMGQWMAINQNLPLAARRMPQADMVWLLVLVVQLTGVALLTVRGRLGGRVTGWPWQRRVAAL